MGGGIGPDRVGGCRGGGRGVQVALAQIHAAADQMNVGILEAGQEHPALEIHHLRSGPHEACRQAIGPHVDDAPAANGHGARPASRSVHRVDGAIPEDQVGRRGNALRGPTGSSAAGKQQQKEEGDGGSAGDHCSPEPGDRARRAHGGAGLVR